ncbi:MAG: antibiotic biosynthesis monooxygenase [Deferrisomatales bacterium]|nr:antibiotic biosynthesis monooxygenase [Deferrisomatales bacterium]
MIQVEVERWVGEGMLEEFHGALLELRGAAARREGFWGGELLARIDDPHHCSAFSTWRSLADWRDWEKSEDRRRVNVRIAPLLDEPETVIVRMTMQGPPGGGDPQP